MSTTPVVVPAGLGETVQRVRVLRWFKRLGDRVALDEALVELTTDKIDFVLPSPAAGVLATIDVTDGAEAGIEQVIGTITS